MEKWTGELAAPPSWLNPELEVTTDDPHPPKGEFIVKVIEGCIHEGCTPDQALGIAANTMNETAWGRAYRAYNLGGVKITKATATKTSRWWRALGNKSSGDSQTCFYRAFSSFADYFHYWIAVFVPKTGKGRYAACGAAFWAGGDWFPLLIKAGYKGPVTAAKPDKSIAEHNQIIRTLRVFWSQKLLMCEPDGVWGKKSKAACAAFQTARGLPATGELDDATWAALTAPAP